ncbi:MAG: histidinol-phosphate transaminase [Anaerolineaceae bacterium]|nr:histidinol-phosphate transaminase [Anaerolineaceae bacterium]
MKTATRFNNFPPYTPIEPFEVLSKRLDLKPEEIIKLDANENPYGPAPAVKKVLADLPYPHIYPDPESRELRSALADFCGLDMEYLLAGAGADELIDLLLRVILEPGETVINCPPTFGMYSFDTRLNFGRVIEVERKTDFSLDIPAIKKQVIQNQAKIIFITSPNNPDGSILSDEDFNELIQLPTLIVLDEAYIEFTGDTVAEWQTASRLRRVAELDNLIVLRTFSKWAGLAGLRVGYGAFPLWMMPTLWAAKQPYNVNVAGNAAALASLGSIAFLEKNIQNIRQERERLFEKLSQIPYLNPFPSFSNFILCEVLGINALDLKNELMKSGIFIRYYQTTRLENMVRFSVGTPDQTEILIQVLEKIL